MGRKIVLTGTTLTDMTAPKLATVDAIESSGSMLLIEPMHPTAQWAAGVPSNGATFQNLYDPLGLGNASFEEVGAIENGVKGKIERSTKGGLHIIVSQANALADGDGARIKMSAALLAHVYANLGHDYYISAWDRLTRANPNIASASTRDYNTANTISVGIAHAAPTVWNVVSGSSLGSRVLGNTVGARFANVGADGAVMASSTAMNGAGLPSWGAPWFTYNQAVRASRNGFWTSFVFYRLYIEDMTVSGRTYAEVDAIDHALYTKEVLTPGGRYYGDTFTDPATIP